MSRIITIDGPAASGKSSAARVLSKRLSLAYLDSGGIYRAVAWKALQKGIDPSKTADMEALCRDVQIVLGAGDPYTIWVDSEDATSFLRTPEVTRAASVLATSEGVRHQLLSLQREIAKKGVVAEGRDMGTVVFPDADLKFYLDATLAVRGERRFRELASKGVVCDRETILREIAQRDHRDQTRAIAPLYAASDAITLDSTSLSLEDVVAVMEKAVARCSSRS